MTRAEKAKQNFVNGYACSQAVVLAFSDLINVNEEEMLKLALPFGGGIGRLRLICGAFSGVALIIGLLFSKAENTKENKTNIYAIIQELADRFEKVNKSLSCAELLKLAELEVEVKGNPEERTKEYYTHRPCENIVYNAAIILEDYLLEKGIL